LKRLGQVILVEVFPDYTVQKKKKPVASKPKLAWTEETEAAEQPEEKSDTQTLEELRAEHEARDCWDDDSEDDDESEEKAELTLEELRAQHAATECWDDEDDHDQACHETATVKLRECKSEPNLPTLMGGSEEEVFMPPDWAQGRSKVEQDEIDRLRWEMWVEASEEEE